MLTITRIHANIVVVDNGESYLSPFYRVVDITKGQRGFSESSWTFFVENGIAEYPTLRSAIRAASTLIRSHGTRV